MLVQTTNAYTEIGGDFATIDLKTAEYSEIVRSESASNGRENTSEVIMYDTCRPSLSEIKEETFGSESMSIASIDSNPSSRNSTMSHNWIRKSFEDLDLEVAQTEVMQKRKISARENFMSSSSFERKHSSSHPYLQRSGSENLDTEIPSTDISPFGQMTSDYTECKRLYGQAIDEYDAIICNCDIIHNFGNSHYNYSPPVFQSCCINCCCSCSSGNAAVVYDDHLLKVCFQQKCIHLISKTYSDIFKLCFVCYNFDFLISSFILGK